MDQRCGLGPLHRRHIPCLFQKENKSEILEISWVLGILQKHYLTFLKLCFIPYNFTYRSLFNFL
jgi:hypothetical protein